MNLLDIPIVSTAIAIVISWALYALFCSYVHEALVQIKAERGRFMKNYLYLQLMDNANGINWAEKLYSHGTIDLLSRDPKKPTNDISPRLFAETLIEVVGSSQLVQNRVEELKNEKWVVSYKSKVLSDFKFGTQILNPSDLVSLFRQAMHSAELKTLPGKDGEAFNEAELYGHLTEYLENWFGELTGRLTLWYKKKTRERLFYLGVLIGIIINVDSLQLFSFYEENPVAKAAIIQYYEDHPEIFLPDQDSATDLAGERRVPQTVPESAGVTTGIIRNSADSTKLDSLVKTKRSENSIENSKAMAGEDSLDVSTIRLIKSMDSLIVSSKLPVGWKYNLIVRRAEMDWGDYLLKILGILISGFAASFGAPFWFDLLKKATSKI
ncbi:hypothetical protein [Dyadobacter sp. LHD-138]|uniref:hypothetical protein n=1 Tax=Dyadobacter sp. LHD-138 TaxID=3071413 RepID=UPI0027E07A1F|nr:hypothetical protein [Dyadobacter sp. LHD-138]MDQ6479774.1 hypothetical protein [Dyadobacter sp. LHD-138]